MFQPSCGSGRVPAWIRSSEESGLVRIKAAGLVDDSPWHLVSSAVPSWPGANDVMTAWNDYPTAPLALSGDEAPEHRPPQHFAIGDQSTPSRPAPSGIASLLGGMGQL